MSRVLLAAPPILAAILTSTVAVAYQRYNDGCHLCHGAFSTIPYAPPNGSAAWPTSLHETHRSSSYMNTACDLCHTNGDNRNPYIGSSNGTTSTPGRGCAGCHGNLYGGVAKGVGLRAHHAKKSVSVCKNCHTDPTPVGENVKPPYYGSPDTKANTPCNNDPSTSEDWSGDGIGLDNDGDGIYDAADPDCGGPACGNGTVDPGETCDPPSSCPTTCNDSNACTVDTMSGSAATCNVTCSHTAISACAGGDGCCPAGCTSITDSDCAVACGNGALEQGETCDPPSSCPTTCNDGNACTKDTMTGSAATCNVACSHTAITTCVSGDGCCPAGCKASNDSDCAIVCGNGVIEAGETCDPPSSCPTTCNDGDACTIDAMIGSPSTCNATCTHNPITTCVGGDGCCPASCTSLTDSDCVIACGNGVIEAGETCDPPSSCPTTCDDGDACTADAMTGSAAACSVACSHTAITACSGGDGCCPTGCTSLTDGDCAVSCGNGVVEAGETCDPPSSCPTTCDDGDACTADAMTGGALTCDAACSHAAITACSGGDGCCPAGCDSATDSDCVIACGNGVTEAGETCDPPSSCPSSCDDGDACTSDTMTGSAQTCDVACQHAPVTACASSDGCCPAGCDSTNDDDCKPGTGGTGGVSTGSGGAGGSTGSTSSTGSATSTGSGGAGGSTTSGGTGGTVAPDAGDDTGSPGDKGSCGCSLPGQGPSSPLLPIAVGGLVLAASRRRRRPR